ncbi:MAG: inorganic diphosphatase [Myxococcota bacterium]|nr:inorganic diphosphatase [Myxococcota bacterium]
MRRARLAPILLALALAAGPAHAERKGDDPVTRLDASHDLLEDFEAQPGEGRIHVVIEIPAGTDAKWELTEDGDGLAWEREDGRLRVVSYLPYPGSYGAVPRTRQSAQEGGDGDPLDALILGPALARGAVVEARPVAILRLRDDGARDDKILAVVEGTPLGAVRDLPDLEERFPGVVTIVETWFRNYKGPGRVEVEGLEDAAAAREAVARAAEAYERDEDD